jgi:hypothetical protein
MKKSELREVEAKWLADGMKRRGISNSALHSAVVSEGFEGKENNITMWRTARAPIPNEWLHAVVKAVEPEDYEQVVVAFYARRFPFLRPYLKEGKPIEIEVEQDRTEAPTNIYYYPTSGKFAGQRFVPHKNRSGKYHGGVSRYSQDLELFETLDEVWERLQTGDDFKLRMSPESGGGPPSLVATSSLVFEYE